MPVSDPASTAMFATARRSSTESASAPGPTNSSTAFVPPPTPISPMTARITSFPVTNAPVLPVSSTWIVSGTACQNDPSARHDAMSVEPSPVPNAPRAPYVQVCESPPAITAPGTIQPSSQSSVCSMPPRPWP